MTKKFIASLAIAILGTSVSIAQTADRIAASASALGANSLTSIQYSGWGSDYVFGQAYDASSPWPRFNLPSIAVFIDFTKLSWLDDRRRAQAESPPLGGGFQPLVGEQHQIWALADGYAWDIVAGLPAPSAAERDMRSAVNGRTTQIWMTPQGFIKAAQAGSTTTRVETVGGVQKTFVSVTTPLKIRLEGVLNDQNLVERVETWIANPVLGDIKLEALFSDYKEFGGVLFPTHIVQRLANYPVLDISVTNVLPNVATALVVPESIRQATPQPAPLTAQKIANGIWIVPGNIKTVIIEFRDHLMVVEAPETESRSLAVIEAIGKAIPGKPIRYVVNTHAHFDHAGGLRTYAAAGAKIVTHASNVPYFQQTFETPRILSPDRLALSHRSAAMEGITGTRTFRDEAQEVEVYSYTGNMHNAGMLMLYLPKEKMLIEADSWTPPGSPNDPPGGVANLAQFLGVVDRLRLDIHQILPIHGRTTTLEEAQAAAAKFSQTQLFK